MAATVFSRPGSRVVRATWWRHIVMTLQTDPHFRVSMSGGQTALSGGENLTTQIETTIECFLQSTLSTTLY